MFTIKFNSEVGESRQGMELFVRMFAGKMNLNHFFQLFILFLIR